MVEIIRTEVTPTHRPPKRTRFCSVYNSGEDATLCLRKFLKDKAPEGWLHRRSCRREKQVQSLQGPITPQEKNYVTFISLSERGKTCFDTFTQTEVEYRHKKRTGDTCHKCKNTN